MEKITIRALITRDYPDNNSIHKPPAMPYAGENLKGSTVTARACLMGANLIDAGGL